MPIGTAGQNAIVRFEGDASERIDLLASDFTFRDRAAVEVYDPGDDEITSGSQTLDADTRSLDEPLELTATGTYAIVIQPDRRETGKRHAPPSLPLIGHKFAQGGR